MRESTCVSCHLQCCQRTIRSMPGEMQAASSSSIDSSELVDAAEQLMSVSKYLMLRTRLSEAWLDSNIAWR